MLKCISWWEQSEKNAITWQMMKFLSHVALAKLIMQMNLLLRDDKDHQKSPLQDNTEWNWWDTLLLCRGDEGQDLGSGDGGEEGDDGDHLLLCRGQGVVTVLWTGRKSCWLWGFQLGWAEFGFNWEFWFSKRCCSELISCWWLKKSLCCFLDEDSGIFQWGYGRWGQDLESGDGAKREMMPIIFFSAEVCDSALDWENIMLVMGVQFGITSVWFCLRILVSQGDALIWIHIGSQRSFDILGESLLCFLDEEEIGWRTGLWSCAGTWLLGRARLVQ